jgi:ATP adenylyltransferase
VAGIDHLWAGWRNDYITSVVSGDTALGTDEHGSLFERILAAGGSDSESYVVHRGPLASALLNAYPYNNGHLLVVPNRAVAQLEDLEPAEMSELWAVVRDAVVALKVAYRCEGVNVGLNLGAAAGAGVPDHLHVHVLPRWSGDTNFMTAVAETRVLPEPLGVTWEKLHDSWPS